MKKATGRRRGCPICAASRGVRGGSGVVPVRTRGGAGSVAVVATVGTNTDWNDVAPGEGAALLELH
jgi:hypothetical protein